MAVKGVELASAYVSLSFSTEKLPGELKKIARSLDDIEVGVEANTKGAAANVGKWRKDEESNAVDVDVDADTAAAKEKVKRWRAEEEHDTLTIDVRADTRSAGREVDALSSQLFKLGRSDVFKLNIGAAAISGLPALASGLGEVAAAIQQVAQAGLALPGIMAGAASSIGTLVFGVTGVSDAYDAMTKASDDAAKSGGDVAAKQRAQMSASFGLRNAIVDEGEARKDVNRAIRDTIRDSQDLNLQMRGGVNDEKRAVHELEKARQRLYSGDFTDYTDALLDVEDAEIRVEEIRSRNSRTAEELAEANAKGIAGSDQVVAANERWIRSQQGVAQAQGAVEASLPGATAAQENAALAMSKLAPEAQDFVNALMDVSGPIQTLRNLVQGNIFRGMDDELRGLAGKSMPMLEKGLGGIGTAWNNTFKEIFRVAGEDDTQGILGRIFGNTEEAQNILTGAIDPLAEGLGVLSEAGSRALPRLADGFVNVAERFSDFITTADESGKLDQWIGEGITAVGNLGEIALNVGKMFTAISEAADGDLLTNLVTWTTKWQEWLNSAEGQNTLTDLFAEGKQIFAEWKPILEDLPGLFQGIYDGARTYIGGLIQILSPITEFLKEHPGLVKTAAEAYLVFKSAQMMSNFAGLITMLGTTLPAEAEKGGTKAANGFHSKFDAAVRGASWIAIGAMVADQITSAFDEQFKTRTSETGMPGSGIWFFNLVKDPKGTLEKTFGDLFGDSGGFLPNNKGAPGVSPFPYGPGIPAGAAVQPSGGRGVGGGNPLAAFTSDANLLSQVPPGVYLQTQAADLTEGIADCSSAVEDLVAIMDGRPTEGRSLSTHNADAWLQEHGFLPGTGGPGDFRVGFNGQHMQATLPGGTPFNWGSDAAAARGGVGGTGADDPAFTDHYYRPTAPSAPAGPRVGPPAVGPPLNSPANTNPALTPSMEDLIRGLPHYDTGGPWPSGTLGVNTTGSAEYVLTPQDIEYLKSQGIDPASLQQGSIPPVDPNTTAHGTGAGMAPGPQQGMPPTRTEGYIPAAAGNTAKVGEGGISSFLDLGESFVHNLIDTGAQAASMAASAAAGAASFGAGAAAGPAASTAIQMGAEAAKRGVSYLYDLGGIWAEAGVEQLMPFGAPRWLGSADPMAFMPQGMPGGQKKAPGTMGAAAQSVQSWAQPGNPAMASGTAQQGGAAALAADPGQGTATPPPQPPPGAASQPGFNPTDPSTWLQFGGIFDSGGVLPPKSFGINLSKKPEYVSTQQQMAGMQKTAAGTVMDRRSGDTNNFYATDVDMALRDWQKHKRREARTHSGRP